MNRTAFVVDGFNVYHSLVDAQRHTGWPVMKWLDLRRLCEAYLSAVGQMGGGRASLVAVDYFSAPPSHHAPDKIARHATYMRCLRKAGVNVELASFKRKDRHCPICKQEFVAHEEKETDVALASRLFEICFRGEADTVVLMTGDSDLAPAVRMCKRLFPGVLIVFAFPYGRVNPELRSIAPESFSMKPRSYTKHQFPDPLVFPDGTSIPKPTTW